MPDPATALPDKGLVDVDRLARWMDAQGLGKGPIADLVPLGGGTQNIIVRFQRGSSRFVLRRPPAHLRANSNETMLREARVLSALTRTDVPHPRLIAACDDTEILGAIFYLMEAVDGFCAPEGLPALHSGSADIRRRMGLALMEGAAALGALDYRAVGLGDFGKPDGFLERQTARWRSQLERYAELPGWPGPGSIPGVTKVERWLEENVPLSSYRPGIIHGDYHIANVLFRPHGPEVAAIIDWELATIGDPLLDVGWMLSLWPDPDGSMPDPEIAVSPWQGFPTTSELTAHYAACSGRDMAALPWFAVLACYKLGILLEGTHARACAGKAPRKIGDRLHAVAVRLFERALRWVGSC
jgi:aminoglycoside phosphotransferase (APT) family kinase protein